MGTRRNFLRFIASIIPLIVVSVAFAQSGPQPAPFETIAKHDFSGHRQKQNYVIAGREEWQSLWDVVHSNVIPIPDLPEVDFSQRMIVAVFQGERSSGGFTITVNELGRAGNKLTVRVTEVSPGASCAVVTVLSQPYHIIVTDKVRKVKFKVRRETRECQ